jgi:cytochrome P450/NADPH-cytochrome P450 reductase
MSVSASAKADQQPEESHQLAPKAIPQPPTRPFVGNLSEIDPNNAIQSFVGMINRYGEIVKVDVMGRGIVLVGSQKMVHEVCDQKRFEKVVKGALNQVRQIAGDGGFIPCIYNESHLMLDQ